jgi:hypothetical protein
VRRSSFSNSLAPLNQLTRTRRNVGGRSESGRPAQAARLAPARSPAATSSHARRLAQYLPRQSPDRASWPVADLRYTDETPRSSRRETRPAGAGGGDWHAWLPRPRYHRGRRHRLDKSVGPHRIRDRPRHPVRAAGAPGRRTRLIGNEPVQHHRASLSLAIPSVARDRRRRLGRSGRLRPLGNGLR